jgi:hypothetical protein
MADPGSAVAQFENSWRRLQQRWAQTTTLWQDSTSQQFERERWSQLEQQAPTTGQAMAQLAAVLAQVQRASK